jgi:hypothetical protein
MSVPSGAIRTALALLLAYALAFAPALAQAARGHMAAAHGTTADAMAALCLTLPDGDGPTPAKGAGDPSHEDCCLTGCRVIPVAAGGPQAGLPPRLAAIITLPPPLPAPQAHAPPACRTPPATGPPPRLTASV